MLLSQQPSTGTPNQVHGRIGKALVALYSTEYLRPTVCASTFQKRVCNQTFATKPSSSTSTTRTLICGILGGQMFTMLEESWVLATFKTQSTILSQAITRFGSIWSQMAIQPNLLFLSCPLLVTSLGCHLRPRSKTT
jgi:hypothetical protein